MNEDNRPLFPQSAVIPFQTRGGKPEILLVTTRSRKHWTIPKGLVDPGFSEREAAEAEALEEAGIEGDISSRPVGEFEYRKWGGLCRVMVFLMRVTTIHPEWLEDDFRERRWWPFDAAADVVPYPALRVLLRRLPELIQARF